MLATAHVHHPAPLEPYVVAGPPRRAAAGPLSTYRRRRLGVLVAIATLVVGLPLGGQLAEARPGGDPAPAPGVPAAVHVVRPGDTLWSIARRYQPEGDHRAVVDALVEANGGEAGLRVGQRLVLPGRV